MNLNESTRTALYRHFDVTGRLLYVGISLDALRRLQQHSRRAAWFTLISRVELEWHSTREEALTAEAIAIAMERPLHNFNRPFLTDTPEIKARQDIVEAWETNSVLVSGDPLHRVIWQGTQWVVSDYGIEARDGCYAITTARIRIRAESLMAHMMEKNWCNVPDFLRAMKIALRIHAGVDDEALKAKSFIVAHVASGAYDGYYFHDSDAIDIAKFYGSEFIGHRFMVIGVPACLGMRGVSADRLMRYSESNSWLTVDRSYTRSSFLVRDA